MTATGRRASSAILLALVIGTALTEEARAQAGLLGPGAAYFGAGASGIATSKLDDHLAARGYPTFGQTAVALNLGAYRILSSKVMLGAEWHGLILGEQTHEGNDVGIGGGYGTLGLGYMVRLSRRARVYPRIGFGGGGMGLWIERDSVVDFDDVLAEPDPTNHRTPVLSRAGAVVDVGVGAELLLGGRGRGTIVGLRAGYLAMSSSTDWQTYDHWVRGGPAASIAGPYIRAVIGVAWRR